MNKMKVGQIGVGNFGAYRRSIMRKTGLFELVAAYDINPSALAQCQKEDGARIVRSYEELLDTPGLEAVIISTGAKYHAEYIIQAVSRRLHVFVEKPLCATPEELGRIIQIQKEMGIVIGVGHVDHFHSAVSMKIKSILDQGVLGTIVTFEKTTAHSGGLLIQPGDWRGDREKNPGGMLFQCGVHGIHELMFYFGPIVEVSCRMRYDVHSTPTADVALCHLQFSSGLIGSLNAYHVTPYRHTFHIFGTRANLYRDDRFFDEGSILEIQRLTRPGEKEPKERIVVDESVNNETAGMRSFYEAVRSGSRCYPGLVEGANAVSVVFAAELSAKQGGISVPVTLLE